MLIVILAWRRQLKGGTATNLRRLALNLVFYAHRIGFQGDLVSLGTDPEDFLA